jgi:glucokinase
MYIGIDVGGTNLVAGLVNENAKILSKVSRPLPGSDDARVLVSELIALIHEVLNGNDISSVQSIGIGLPGSVDKRSGDVIYCCNIPSLTVKTPLVSMIQGEFAVPVCLENDANAAALGEAYGGAAKGCDHSVFITLGTGVGGGIIINGAVYAGFNDLGAELGHMVIVHNGRLCGCGRRGCWETYASATGLIFDTREAMQRDKDSLMWSESPSLDAVNGRTSFNAARKGDAAAIGVINGYIDMLACGLTSIINIFEPEVLCIGGGIGNEFDYFIKPLTVIVHRDGYNRTDNKTRLCKAVLGNDAGVIGAAFAGK